MKSRSRLQCLPSVNMPHIFNTKPEGYKTIFMLNLTEHEICPPHQCCSDNKSGNFSTYKPDKYILSVLSSKNLYCKYLGIYEQFFMLK